MTDHLSKEKRSWNMSRIKSENTSPEIKVRKLLHKLGYRFRLHYKKLPGKPDIALPKYKIVIFVHGCFWHQHRNCKRATIPKSNQEYWNKKFNRNIKRFNEVDIKIREYGWRVFIIWECETNNDKELIIKIDSIFNKKHMPALFYD